MLRSDPGPGWILALALCAASAAPIARAENLIINGDFEEPLTPAWTPAYGGGECTFERDAGLDPDPDFEARAHLPGTGYGRLLQVVAVPDPELEFRARLRVHAVGTGDAWAAAAVVLTYLDETQAFLGETRLGSWTHNCPWENGPDQHLIGLPNDLWLDWVLSLNEELEELPAVDPPSVRFVRVGLYVQGYEC